MPHTAMVTFVCQPLRLHKQIRLIQLLIDNYCKILLEQIQCRSRIAYAYIMRYIYC